MYIPPKDSREYYKAVIEAIDPDTDDIPGVAELKEFLSHAANR